jgi:hypothetical protein
MEFITIKQQLVELPILANTTLRKFNFPTQNFLRAKNIVSIEIYTVNDMTVSPQGNTLPTTGNLTSGYLTLYGDNPEAKNADGEWLQQIALPSLHRINNLIDPFVFGLYTLQPRKIVWEKSYVELFAAAGNTANLSFLFLVGYQGNEGDNGG